MKTRILVVDDEPDALELIEVNLKAAGFEVVSAANGRVALEKARANAPALILLDVMLPEVDGLEVCKNLRRDPKTTGIPIIMLTARAAELDRVLGHRSPSLADLPSLRYTEMVFAESMRLYPPAWALSRLAHADYEAGGVPIPAGSVCVMSQYVTHRDPRFFPDPDRFDPERFASEARDARPKFAYFPFGGGTRVCIGERFAWMEGVLVMAAIAQKWRLRLEPGQRVEPLPLITLRVKNGLRMTARPRSAG